MPDSFGFCLVVAPIALTVGSTAAVATLARLEFALVALVLVHAWLADGSGARSADMPVSLNALAAVFAGLARELTVNHRSLPAPPR